MTTYKLHFNIRHFIHYCLFLLMSIAVCLSVYTVIDQETNLISYALKEKLQLNLFFRVINNYMVPKIISAVILFLLALFLMIMYYFSYFDLAYMRLTLLCLLGICYNFWIVEVETIFHGGQVMTQLWNKCSLIFACLMILFLISYIYESYFLRLPLILRTSLIFIAAAAILSMTVQSYSDAIKTAGLLYIYFSAILFLTQAALLFLKHYGNFFALLLPWSAAAGIIFLNDLYRTRNLSAAQIQSYTTLYNLSMLIVPAVIIYLTLMTVFHRQNTFFHDRETNRKIQEIDKTKHVLQKYIETSIIPHTKALTRLTDALTEHPYFDPQLLPEIRDMEREVRQIHLTAKKVGAYSIFQGEMIEMTLKLVNLNTIIGRAVNALQKDSILTDNDSTIIQEHIGYVNAPPGKLTQVIKDLFMALREMNDWGFINIHCFSAKNQVHIHLFLDEAPILSDKTRDHLKFPQKRPAYSLKKQQSFEYTLSVCQYILRSCGGRLKIASAKGIHIQLSLPLISQKPPEFEQKTTLHPDTDVALTDKILLISSDSEQQTQLFDLLKDGIYNYTLTQANDGVYLHRQPGRTWPLFSTDFGRSILRDKL